MCVVTHDAALAAGTRRRLWAEHLECREEDLAGDALDAIETRWKPVAAEQLRRARDGQAATHRLIELPGVSRRTDRLLGPISGLFDDG